MSQAVRVRFAPSPTGFLHIGGVRTALFNWLYARHFGGQFLLRIEDTDLERSEQRFTDDILASMKWLGLDWDEEPIYQAKRLEVYRQKAEELISRGQAYRCYCTEAEVEKMREKATAEGKKPMYDRHCRNIKDHPLAKTGAPYVIRAALPETGIVEFDDLIRGHIVFDNTELDDFVLIRSNGAPTYNLSVVVDDVHSRMTHIIRGDDHINNTPKQVHLYNYFQYPQPKFAHLPMILGSDKKKLSKRHGAVSANVYREEGYLPEVLLNFLARLGWSHGDQEIFSVEEMIKFFSFDHVQKSSAVFNLEKLQWLNATHIRAAKPERLLKIVLEDYAASFSPDLAKRVNSDYGVKCMALIQQKIKFVRDAVEQLLPLCQPGVVEVKAEEIAAMKCMKDPALKTATQTAVKELLVEWSQKIKAKSASCLGDLGFSHQEVDASIRAAAEKHGVKLGDLAQPMRLLVTGRSVSVSLFDLLVFMPWEVAEARLNKIALL